MKKYRPHLLVLCVLAIIFVAGWHKTLQNAIADLRFGLGSRQASGGIVLIAIDAPSLKKVGVWPWSRELHAHLIDRLVKAGATDIVFDVDFSSPSNPGSDRAFAEALEKAGGSVVLPAFKQLASNRDRTKTVYVTRPLPEFSHHAWSAIVNVKVEPDGLVRRYSYGDTLEKDFIPSVGSLLAGKYDSKEKPFQIDYSINAASLPVVSYVDVLQGDSATLKVLKGRKAIVGGTAIELGDRFNMPKGGVVPGVILQLLAAESILQGRTLHASSNIITLGGVVGIGLLMLALWGRFSAGARVVVLIGLAVAIESGAILLQAKFPVIPDTSIWHAAIVAYLAAMALDEIDFRRLLGGIAEKRFQRIAMSLGDGLVCTDRNGLITVWNPGATAIFGYEQKEIIGQALSTICVVPDGAGKETPISLLDMPPGALQGPGGKVVELEGRRKNGEIFPIEVCLSEWQGIDGAQYGALIRDISVRKREAERIKYLAEHDTLTNLANRNKVQEYLRTVLGTAETERCEIALLMMDLDKFKQINDALGHAYGDQLLRDVAKRLNTIVDGAGLVARLSGDEFAVVINSAIAADNARELSERVSSAFCDTPFSIGARQVYVNVSIGIAVYPRDCKTVDELLVGADLALYRAKAAGRGRCVVFEPGLRYEFESRLALETDLSRAIERNQFEVYYQPQISLADGRLVGAEALIRWHHPRRGLVLPDDFMPVVNASSISDTIALWVMETACRQGSLWHHNGHDIRLGVNLSPSQFHSGDLVATVESILSDTGFSPSLLELEVTESILLEDDDRALKIFRRLQDLGITIAFDDFGTGYASLTYLKKFPLNKLKIDKSFVRKLRADSEDMAIVGATISLAKLLGLSVIAEGIEDRSTAELLLSKGCEEGQGYCFGRPMPAAEFGQKFLTRDDGLDRGVSAARAAATAA
jgi:diguanylate cyclase (GGDEF)-like protein/PAS domain S-box-containing protein